VAWFALSVADGLRGAPPDFRGILVRPGALAAGLASALVLVQPLLALGKFRVAVRLALLFVLTCGGFALRQNYQDYQEMLARRKNATQVMNLSETTPVLRSDTQLVHLPAAPCRFAPDGGYVQGCNLELAQRFLQTDYRKVAAHDPGEVNTLGLLLGSLLVFTVFSFLAARWFCGWLCPLSTMGDAVNVVRKKLGFAPWRPGPRVKWGMFFSGAGLLALAGAMAAATPFLDAQGRFAGCKIPIFPFCKLCPNQQLCPMAGTGPAAYPPLPTPEWGFGLFRYGCVVILLLFALCFIASRRLWCWFCPMGMVSGLFNRGGLFKLRKDAAKCNRCGVCAEVCPMSLEHIPGEMKDTDVGRYGCVLCLRCVEKCPRNGCLALEHNGSTVVESKFKA
jgi:NAD-dependent dihydropyrimidine dehydrogenase PreA subunit